MYTLKLVSVSTVLVLSTFSICITAIRTYVHAVFAHTYAIICFLAEICCGIQHFIANHLLVSLGQSAWQIDVIPNNIGHSLEKVVLCLVAHTPVVYKWTKSVVGTNYKCNIMWPPA